MPRAKTIAPIARSASSHAVAPLNVLKIHAEKQSKKHLHQLGFSEPEALPQDQDKELRKKKGSRSLPSLAQVFDETDYGKKAQMLDVLERFAYPYSTEYTRGVTLENLDIPGLDAELLRMQPDEERWSPMRTRPRRKRMSSDIRRGRRWAAEALFDEHYQMPSSEVAEHLSGVDGRTSLGSSSSKSGLVRPTIARIEESLSPEELAALPPASRAQSSTAKAMVPSEPPPPNVRIFEASEVYRQVCETFDILAILPTPFFGDIVDIDSPLWGTRHAFAVASAVKLCAPREIRFVKNLLTDEGAAKIVEMALSGARMEKIHIEGSTLSYKTMSLLYSNLKSNWTVTSIVLRGCGLGANMDVDSLPEPSAVYTECAKSAEADLTLERSETPVLLPLFMLAAQSMTLRYLDLSENMLSEEAWACLKPLLRGSKLETLVLNRCLLENHTALVLADGLQANTTLLELRLRANMFHGSSAMRVLFGVIAVHQRLAHFDFAENNLCVDGVEALVKMLRRSQSLLAVHLLAMDRDSGVCKEIHEQMDLGDAPVRASAGGTSSSNFRAAKAPESSRGEDEEELVLWRALHVKDMAVWRSTGLGSTHVVPSRIQSSNQPASLASVLPCGCWLCNQRMRFKFRWTFPESGVSMMEEGQQIFVLPSFTGFSKVELFRAQSSNSKSIVFARDMLVPPGAHCYLFELGAGNANNGAGGGSRPVGLRCAQDSSSEDIESAMASLAKDNEEAPTEAYMQFFKSRGYTGRLNVMQLSKADFHIPEGSHHKDDLSSLQIGDKSRKEESEWRQRLRKCYEADLAHIHFQDLCHTDEQYHVEAILWSRYSLLYEVFAIFAGRSAFPFIRQMDVYDFFEAANVVEKLSYDGEMEVDDQDGKGIAKDLMAHHGIKQLSLQDVQQLLVQTMAGPPTDAAGNSGGKRQGEMSEQRAAVLQKAKESRPLARPEFLELILRISITLFSAERSLADALKQFTDKVLVEKVLRPPLAPFPKALMWTSEVNGVFLEHTQTLRQAHERYGKNTNSFIQLAQLMKLYDKTFTAKNVASLFALARQPLVDAYQTKGTTSLTYAEFSESLVRFSLVRRNQSEQMTIFKELAENSNEQKGGTAAIGARGREPGTLGAVNKLRDQVRRTVAVGEQTQILRQKRFAAHVGTFLMKLKERLKAPKMIL